MLGGCRKGNITRSICMHASMFMEHMGLWYMESTPLNHPQRWDIHVSSNPNVIMVFGVPWWGGGGGVAWLVHLYQSPAP